MYLLLVTFVTGTLVIISKNKLTLGAKWAWKDGSTIELNSARC